jgi:hypothetical protein
MRLQIQTFDHVRSASDILDGNWSLDLFLMRSRRRGRCSLLLAIDFMRQVGSW